jgi:hypothetical protein
MGMLAVVIRATIILRPDPPLRTSTQSIIDRKSLLVQDVDQKATAFIYSSEIIEINNFQTFGFPTAKEAEFEATPPPT